MHLLLFAVIWGLILMVYCPNCGERNRDGSRFCRNCGALIEDKPLKSRLFSGEGSEPSRPAESPAKTYERPTLKTETGQGEGFEWDTVIAGALFLVISMVILERLIGAVGVIFAVIGFFLYVLASARRKSAVILLLTLSLLTAATINAFFSI